MKISFNWLKQFIDIPVSVDQAADLLTHAGLEVEGVDSFCSIQGGLEGLVIGEVVEKTKHPDADKLSLTKVSIGANEDLLPIVCGAPNVEAGQKVVVATVGTTLYPSGGEPFQIKKAKIRGQVSIGMICAEDEIGLGESHDGIMVLPSDTPVGIPAAEYFNIYTDTIIEIGLTPNRADAMSHFGVARDLLATLKAQGQVDASVAPLRLPAEKIRDKVYTDEKPIEVQVENTDACPRYCGVTISQVTVKDSPEWLQNKLKAIGLKPINNVVDATNYILHGFGQPLHAFDANQIIGNKVIVKTLPSGTSFQTLDEVERKLHENDLMICNQEEGMCIAGVFGGIKSGVTETTKRVFLESAYFNPVYVRKTAKRQGLSTDASFRFERGIDPNTTADVLQIAANLIAELTGGVISSDIYDSNPAPVKPFEIELSVEKLNAFLGLSFSKQEVIQLLASLDIEVAESGEMLLCKVPPYRNDVQRKEDIYEEVLRLHGFNKVPFPGKHHFSVSKAEKFNPDVVQDQVADYLASLGYVEGMSNSLTSSKYYSEMGSWQKEKLVSVLNPLSSELDVLRQSLLFNALEAVVYNQNRQQLNVKLFEFGRVYSKVADNQYQEEKQLAITLVGNQLPYNWKTSENQVDVFHAKGLAEAVLAKLGIDVSQLTTTESSLQEFDYGLSLLKGQKCLVSLGKVSDKLSKFMDCKQAVFYTQFHWDALLKVAKKQKTVYQPVPKYPAVKRDLALLVDTAVSYGQLKALALQMNPKLLKKVDLFDVYEGKNLPSGKKSYGLSFVFLDENKTLNDKAIEKAMSKLQQQFEKQLGAQLR